MVEEVKSVGPSKPTSSAEEAVEEVDSKDWTGHNSSTALPSDAVIMPENVPSEAIGNLGSIQFDLTKVYMPMLHLFQRVVSNELREREQRTFRQSLAVTELNTSLEGQIKVAMERQKEAESKQAVVAKAIEEAC